MNVYRALVAPLLLGFDAETVHGLAIRAAELASANGRAAAALSG